MKLTKSWLEPQNKPFDSSMLKAGEMMEIIDGKVLLRTFDRIISLNNPNYTYVIDATFPGRKLQSGESVTLTQE